MMKKRMIAALMLALLIVCAFSGCKISDDGGEPKSKAAISMTTQPEQFFGKVPNCDFKNKMAVQFDTDYYTINVKCSAEEFAQYMVLVKQCGFLYEVYEDAEGKYEAKNADGMTADIGYNSHTGELTAFYMINE